MIEAVRTWPVVAGGGGIRPSRSDGLWTRGSAPHYRGGVFSPNRKTIQNDFYRSGGAGSAPRGEAPPLQGNHRRRDRAQSAQPRGQEPRSHDGGASRGPRE